MSAFVSRALWSVRVYLGLLWIFAVNFPGSSLDASVSLGLGFHVPIPVSLLVTSFTTGFPTVISTLGLLLSGCSVSLSIGVFSGGLKFLSDGSFVLCVSVVSAPVSGVFVGSSVWCLCVCSVPVVWLCSVSGFCVMCLLWMFVFALVVRFV